MQPPTFEEWFKLVKSLPNNKAAAWKSTNIYPIPKPKEWECQPNNTHPITLLDTTRKALVHLLNNCIAKIFLNNRILKGNQFAGLPGTSTFEPIHIINEIIQDAREMKNEIWILFQDLSKAYV
nr:9876_t:CDS:2 [Entrophospora candida]